MPTPWQEHGQLAEADMAEESTAVLEADSEQQPRLCPPSGM